MFSTSSRPLPLSAACLQSLCASLNAPVVRLEGLPSGPARAAVVVYAEQYGDLGVAVAIRSLEGGQVALMRYPESLPPDHGPAAALEIAVSYAEGLGFLFDDDMIGPDDGLGAKAAAFEHWQRLVGSDEVFAAPDVVSPPVPEGEGISAHSSEIPDMDDLLSGSAGDAGEPVDLELDELSLGHLGAEHMDTGAAGELVLDELAPLEIGEGVIDTGGRDEAWALEVEAQSVGVGEARGRAEATEPIVEVQARTRAEDPPRSRAAFAPSKLSKFRRPEDEVEDESGGESPRGGSALGRIQIVRKRQNEDGRAAARSRIHASY